MEDQQSMTNNLAIANILSFLGILAVVVAAITKIIGWAAPATVPWAEPLAYLLVLVAFFLKQSETISLRRVMRGKRP